MLRKAGIVVMSILVLAISACEVDPPDSTDFSGSWNCNEESSLYGTQSYQVQINHDSLAGGLIYLSNFYNLGAGSKATVYLYGFEAEIPSQTIGSKTVSGTGDLINANKMMFEYIVVDGIDADTVSSVLTRVL